MVALPGVRPRPAHRGDDEGGAGARTGAAARRRARQAAERALPQGRGVIRKRVSRLTFVSVALLAIAGVGLVQVLQTSQITAIGYDVRALELERQALDAQIRVLEADIATSTNLGHLHQQAVERLGMVPAAERLRIAVDVPAPHAVPLPRRYVPEQEYAPLPEPTWWEVTLGRSQLGRSQLGRSHTGRPRLGGRPGMP